MYIADLHIHSKYSRATSRECDSQHLDLWAKRKGIGLLGTGDFTHPAWRQELKERLEPAEEGLYTLKEEYVLEDTAAAEGQKPRFVVSGEISSIYKKNGKTRKVHNLILLPGLAEAEQLARRLEAIGNIHSDGRPILGLDSRDLLEITLETCPQAIFIPAHIWTPHFSLFGAFSAFDTIEECFEDLTSHIHALETGLSSDPPMNWRLSALDGYQLVSNSDAHSPAKLGREANLLEADLSYKGLYEAVQNGKGLAGTIEFFPEEGKYHLDGHRKCQVCLSPGQTKEYGGICPVCGRKITVGVLHRVEELADREEGFVKPGACSFESLAPLPEVIAASTDKSASSVKVQRQYEAMLRELGPEFSILRTTPLEAIRSCAGPCIAEGIKRLREGKVERIPGFDGEYGKINIIDKEEIAELCGQMSLFESIALPAGSLKKKPNKAARETETASSLEPEGENLQCQQEKAGVQDKKTAASAATMEENREQREAITSQDLVTAVIAGPGTGKTYTLTRRIAWLVKEQAVKPADVVAVTFTNKAAKELKERLEGLLGRAAAKRLTIGTFHSICLNLLQEEKGAVILADEDQQLDLAVQILKEWGIKAAPKIFLRRISAWKNGMELEDSRMEEAARAYAERLKEQELYDFDDLILEAMDCSSPAKEGGRIFVDEFQDINQAQYRLLEGWSKNAEELFAIGDPDQSIYGFRGADSGCFQHLKETYPQLRVIRLKTNYRSAPEILNCAIPVINKNPGQKRCLVPACLQGEKVRLVKAESALSEGIFIAGAINRMTGGMDMMDAQSFALAREQHRSFSDIAVLYRTRRQAKLLETCLQKESIPYTVTGKEDFLEDKIVRGTIDFFRSLIDFQESDFPEARSQAMELFETNPGQTLRYLTDFFAPKRKERPEELIKQWREKTGFSGVKSLQRLQEMTIFYDDMKSFLENLLLGEEQDLKRNACGNLYKAGAVSLMTLHAAKGLEFPVVFLCGLDEDKFPAGEADIEEERRLFYVGMTRAKEELLLTCRQDRPSTFLSEIPQEFLCQEDAYKRKPAVVSEQMHFL